MVVKGALTDNIFVERFWRSLKYVEVCPKACYSVADAKRSIRRCIVSYNSNRPHASLDGNTSSNIHEHRTTGYGIIGMPSKTLIFEKILHSNRSQHCRRFFVQTHLYKVPCNWRLIIVGCSGFCRYLFIMTGVGQCSSV